MSNSPLVSVVITTKNEEQNIGLCLDSILDQSHKNIEIILVDNNSSDETKEIGYSKGAKVFNYGPERSAQRNYGMIQVATGEYVMYVDADMLMTRHLIFNCVTSFVARTDLVALYIPEKVLGNTLFCKTRRFERNFYDGTVIDAARFFRKEVFIQSGGFDSQLFELGSGEDWDLDKKIRALGNVEVLQMSSSKSSIDSPSWLHRYAKSLGVDIQNYNGLLHDESKDKLIQYLLKKRYYAEGFSGYISKWGKNDPDVIKQFGLFYRLIGVFFENQKWKLVLRSPQYYFLVVALKAMVGLATKSKWKI